MMIPSTSVVCKSLSGSKRPVQSILRAYSHYPPARRRWSPPRAKSNIVYKRNIVVSERLSYADLEASLDPRQQDRESDEVDVCIIGGGTCQLALGYFNILISKKGPLD